MCPPVANGRRRVSSCRQSPRFPLLHVKPHVRVWLRKGLKALSRRADKAQGCCCPPAPVGNRDLLTGFGHWVAKGASRGALLSSHTGRAPAAGRKERLAMA